MPWKTELSTSPQLLPVGGHQASNLGLHHLPCLGRYSIYSIPLFEFSLDISKPHLTQYVVLQLIFYFFMEINFCLEELFLHLQ